MASNGPPPKREASIATSLPAPRPHAQRENNPGTKIGQNHALDILFGLEFLRPPCGLTCNSVLEDSE